MTAAGQATLAAEGPASRGGPRPLYVPSWPGLAPADFVRPRPAARRFPLAGTATPPIEFFRARHALFHLFSALRGREGPGTVIVPDYHSGSEVAAIRAAGLDVRFYRIGRDLQPDGDRIERLCREGAKALFVIHYLGWPQPIGDLCAVAARHGVPLVEDCALALFSESAGRPLGSFGRFSVFCLYKTLAVPHGGLLAQNAEPLLRPGALRLRACGVASTAGRTAELLLERLRARRERTGRTLFALKRRAGQALRRLPIRRLPVGDIGFPEDEGSARMSGLCRWLVRRCDPEAIRARRRANYLRLEERLDGAARPLFPALGEGVCPLFFPIVARDKAATARALRAQGIEAVEFWNDGDEASEGEGARFLRRHVLELPIHQDVTDAQIDDMAARVRALGGLR